MQKTVAHISRDRTRFFQENIWFYLQTVTGTDSRYANILLNHVMSSLDDKHMLEGWSSEQDGDCPVLLHVSKMSCTHCFVRISCLVTTSIMLIVSQISRPQSK
ncbi:hypothetical protein TNCV_4434401 [Trichonephila clavipes]|nr:hypothetical protein TNCV_4434401 [Trichonephila clavipes]